MKSKIKWTHESIPDLTGKVSIVTGANSGLGLETAKVLAARNATVIMACRSTERGESAVAGFTDEQQKTRVKVMQLDLSSLTSVKAFAEHFKNSYDRIDLLINNAGVMMCPYKETEDGFELQIGVNHFGHFALTGLLADLWLKTDGSRIINVSSFGHKMGHIDFADLHYKKRKYSPMEAYSQSKLANLLFTYQLARKLAAAGNDTIAAAAHPGWAGTNLQRHARIFRLMNPFFAQSPLKGAWPSLYAATAEDVKSGDYFGPDGLMEIHGHPKKVESNKESHNLDDAKRLWEISEELTEVTYTF